MIAPLAALGAADRWIFLKMNRDWAASMLNAVMPTLTDLHKVAWFRYGAAPAAVALWLWRGRRKALKVFVVAALVIAASDMLASRVIKPWAKRERPSFAIAGAVVRAPIAGRYSFPSNHAANMGAAASVLSVAYPGGTFFFAAAAAAVAYSRVYVGAHYPSDVFAGLALGAVIGWPWAALMLGGATKRKSRT